MTAPSPDLAARLAELQQLAAAATPWLQEALDDRPEGAYRGRFTYHDIDPLRAALGLANSAPAMAAALTAVLELCDEGGHEGWLSARQIEGAISAALAGEGAAQ